MLRNGKTGAIEVNADECIGCRMCRRASPFGAMGFDTNEKLADKCDLCGGEPECVKHCFYGALEFKEPEKTVFDMNRTYANKVKDAYLQEVKE